MIQRTGEQLARKRRDNKAIERKNHSSDDPVRLPVTNFSRLGYQRFPVIIQLYNNWAIGGLKTLEGLPSRGEDADNENGDVEHEVHEEQGDGEHDAEDGEIADNEIGAV